MSIFIACFYCLILLEVFYYWLFEVFLRLYEYVCIMKAHYIYMNVHIVGRQKSVSKGYLMWVSRTKLRFSGRATTSQDVA